jgi:hypothetical protein
VLQTIVNQSTEFNFIRQPKAATTETDNKITNQTNHENIWAEHKVTIAITLGTAAVCVLLIFVVIKKGYEKSHKYQKSECMPESNVNAVEEKEQRLNLNEAESEQNSHHSSNLTIDLAGRRSSL